MQRWMFTNKNPKSWSTNNVLMILQTQTWKVFSPLMTIYYFWFCRSSRSSDGFGSIISYLPLTSNQWSLKSWSFLQTLVVLWTGHADCCAAESWTESLVTLLLTMYFLFYFKVVPLLSQRYGTFTSLVTQVQYILCIVFLVMCILIIWNI